MTTQGIMRCPYCGTERFSLGTILAHFETHLDEEGRFPEVIVRALKQLEGQYAGMDGFQKRTWDLWDAKPHLPKKRKVLFVGPDIECTLHKRGRRCWFHDDLICGEHACTGGFRTVNARKRAMRRKSL